MAEFDSGLFLGSSSAILQFYEPNEQEIVFRRTGRLRMLSILGSQFPGIQSVNH
jgi:hypothetical protein